MVAGETGRRRWWQVERVEGGGGKGVRCKVEGGEWQVEREEGYGGRWKV